MKIQCFLDEEDFLTYQLFTASKSERIRMKRIRAWLYPSFLFLVLSLITYRFSLSPLPLFFLLTGVLSLGLYPFYSRWRYKDHYKKFIRENRKGVIGKMAEITFSEDFIIEKSDLGESKLNTSELEQINEISSHYFLKMNTGHSLIINKTRLANPEEFRAYLESLMEAQKLPYEQELNWKWR
ncbi:MAG: YcxB family protein [Bacteroidota bacterium]